MTEEVRQKILNWIYDNHSHHDHDYIPIYDDQGFEVSSEEKWVDCEDAEFPYVNSIELEKFIKEL